MSDLSELCNSTPTHPNCLLRSQAAFDVPQTTVGYWANWFSCRLLLPRNKSPLLCPGRAVRGAFAAGHKVRAAPRAGSAAAAAPWGLKHGSTSGDTARFGPCYCRKSACAGVSTSGVSCKRLPQSTLGLSGWLVS